MIGLRESGLTYEAIAAQVGLTRTGVFDICRRFAEQGRAGLVSGPRGPAPGTGRFLEAEQEARVRALISRHTPDDLGLPSALWSRAAVRMLIERQCGVQLAVRTVGTYLALGLHGSEAAPTGLRAVTKGRAALAAAGLSGHRGASQTAEGHDLLGGRDRPALR